MPVQSGCDPSRKTTLPVGVPLPVVGTTAAVRVTLPPVGTEGALALSRVVVDATDAETVKLSAEDVLALSYVSPAYAAVMECAPSASVLMVSVATPLELSTLAPSEVVPSRKVTMPVGVFDPEAGLTVAVKVTKLPVAMALALARRTVVVETTG
jgi:hypothetical protein